MATTTAAPGTDWREDVAPDEDERFERHAEVLRDLQRKRSARAGAGRALHRKGHGALAGELEIHDGLPVQLRAGIAARPATYKAYVRFSNGVGAHRPDPGPDVRGLAVKLVGVPGKKLIPGMEDAVTQDFLMINVEAMPFATADEFVTVVSALDHEATAMPKLLSRVGVGRTVELTRFLGSLAGGPPSLATLRYFTALPLRWGDRAAKLSLVPHARGGGVALTRRRPGYLAADLRRRAAGGTLAWDLAVQLYVDPARTPIEDATVTWDAPWQVVGTLRLPSQDMTSPRGRALTEWVEGLSFDPWHALVEHRPLGNLMRARNHAYRLSTQERAALPEPTGAETF